MPRPRRAHGRPGTQVIPDAWEADHAPVMVKTMKATVKVWPRVDGAPEPVLNDDLTYEPVDPSTPIYTGPARIQVEAGQQTQSWNGQQVQVLLDYLVVLDRNLAGADDVAVGCIIEVTECDDASLLGDRRLYVGKVARGSLLWERDTWCTDDLTALSGA